MYKIISLFFFLGLLVIGCDKVKDSPQPDLFDGIDLSPISVSAVLNGEATIDLVTANHFNADVSMRIKTQPNSGQVVLDEVRKLFVYRPNHGFFGRDSAIYEVCKSIKCKTGVIRFLVVDTTQPCVLQSIPILFMDSILVGEPKFLTIPALFDCSGKITEITGSFNPDFLNLDSSGRIWANFPQEFQTGTLDFTIKVCTPDMLQCQTSQVQLSIVNRCADLFLPADTTVSALAIVSRISLRVKHILAKALKCDSSEIDESTFQIVVPPAIDLATVDSARDMNGNAGPLFLKLKRNSTGVGSSSLTYTVKNAGVSKTAKVFYLFNN